MHPRPAVGSTRLVIDALDTFTEFGIGELARGRNMLVPLVEGGPGDLEQRARLGDVALLGLLRLDERERVHRVSLAKKAVARLRMSRSSRNTRFSLRSCASSANCALVNPSRSPSSMSACFTHARTAVWVRSRSRATLAAEFPGWRTSSTTSALNSLVNDRRGR